ncbi:MAG: hypothetical protein EBX50_01495 [Chitinophagia bacterium]|nr:hypothetical protein [Chitinophagia bacterium]
MNFSWIIKRKPVYFTGLTFIKTANTTEGSQLPSVIVNIAQIKKRVKKNQFFVHVFSSCTQNPIFLYKFFLYVKKTLFV